MIMVDWYCKTDAVGMYWAVHDWSGGYAGFQNKNGDHVLLLFLWEDGDSIPEIEYVSPWCDTSDFDFGNEGEGKHIFTNYAWETGKWYTMCIGTKTIYGKTFYAQWVREVDGEWILTCILSFPEADRKLDKGSMFQEDFSFTRSNVRKCRLRNAYGHNATSGAWKSWAENTITNSYFPYEEITWDDCEWNVTCYCNWGYSSSGKYVWIQSGGTVKDNGKSNPPTKYIVSQNDEPDDPPNWAALTPRYIQSYHGLAQSNPVDLYISPDSTGTKVIQTGTMYLWKFIDSGDGYFYITNGTKAIAISGTSNGDDLVMETYSAGTSTQKWTKTAGDGAVVYLYPKNALTKNMDIENAFLTYGTPIQIYEHNESTSQFKWYLFSYVTLTKIQSYWSSLYVAPSGTSVIQSADEYVWNVVYNDSQYFHILTKDNTKAVALSGTASGNNLILEDYDPESSSQQWYRKYTDVTGTYYLISKAIANLYMDIEGPS